MNALKKGYLVALATLISATSFAQFRLIAAETTSGSVGGNTAQYGGVQVYDFATTGGAAAAGTGIPASALHDAIGVVVRGSDLYVSNRYGNTLGQGSIQRFGITQTGFTGGAEILTASNANFQGFHGFNFAPDGDIWVSTVNNGSRHYTGSTDVGGSSFLPVRDAWVSPDGKRLIESQNTGLRVTNLTTNTSTFFALDGNFAHQMQYQGGALYVTTYANAGQVYKVDLNANFEPIAKTSVATPQQAIGLAFSPDGAEMFVSGHQSDNISRYLWNGSAWAANGTISTGHNMGYLATVAVVPEPASLAALGLGLAAFARKRRKN
ncbi:MAG: WD40 repeat domain-containing protein [Armatimonadota bacterium]